MNFDKRKALQNALAFAQQGRWERAIAEYQAILKADPRDFTVLNTLGDLYARTGRTAEAIELYLTLGELYRTDGLSVKAIAVYKKIVKLDPSRIEAHLACADLYEEQGLAGEARVQLAIVADRYAKAGDSLKVIDIYQRLVQLDPTNFGLITKLADHMLREGMREAAAAEYERAALVAQAVGQAAESRRLLQKVRELTPEGSQANLAVVEQQFREGKYAEVVDALTRSRATDPDNPQIWRLLGEAHCSLGRAADAASALERAVALGLPEEAVGASLVTVLVQAGRTEEGIAVCQRLTDDAVRRGQPEEAIAICQTLLTVGPHLVPIQRRVVDLLHQVGRDKEAHSAMLALAAAHEACGEIDAAINVYHQLLERDRADTMAQARLDVLEGSPAAAVEPGTRAIPPIPAGPTIEDKPGFVLEEVLPEEPPVIELPEEGTLALEDDSAFQAGGSFELEARSGPVFELDESGELASVRLTREERGGDSLDPLAGTESSWNELRGEDWGTLSAEEEAPGKVSEHLAEAEVYLKYGLIEKARERLLEAVRLAPDSLVARRRLKALYRMQPQVAEACGEVLAIARILEAQGERDAAVTEVEEGLAMAPEHAELRRLRDQLRSGEGLPPVAEPVTSGPAEPLTAEIPASEVRESAEIVEAFSLQGGPSSTAHVGDLPGEGAATVEAAQPDVPPLPELPLDTQAAEIAALRAPSPTPRRGDGLTSLPEGELPPELRALLEEPALILQGGETTLDLSMADDLAEAEFYLSQGMVDEVRAVHRRMQARGPEHPAVAQLAKQLQSLSAGGTPEAAEESTTGPVPSEQPAEASTPVAMAPEVPVALTQRLGAPVASTVFGVTPSAPDDVAPVVPPEMATLQALGAIPPVETVPQEAPIATERVATGPPRGQPEERRHESATQDEGRAPAWTAEMETPQAQEPALPPGTIPRIRVMDSGTETGVDSFINLGAELEEEMAVEERAAPLAMDEPLLEDLLKEFQRGTREQLDEKDFETHYNLGIAYKEMDLHDEAIQEFRLASRDPARALVCANLLGLCFLGKGNPDEAIRELRAGLEVPGHPREAYHGLWYDLGVAYEARGDLSRALESFEALQVEDAHFRDVRLRVKVLRERLRRPGAATAPTSPVPAGGPPKHTKGKQKISFI